VHSATQASAMYMDFYAAKRRGRCFEKLFGLDTKFRAMSAPSKKLRSPKIEPV
jgi:hypothetical protein